MHVLPPPRIVQLTERKYFSKDGLNNERLTENPPLVPACTKGPSFDAIRSRISLAGAAITLV